MADGRYVVVGLARARAQWFRDVTAWANAAVIPVEFQKCIGASEVRARLAAPGRLSAVLVESGAGGLDRSLIAAATDRGAAVLVIDHGAGSTDWAALGVAEVLTAPLRPDQLVDALARHVGPEPARPTAGTLLDIVPIDATRPAFRGRSTTVIGAPGAGTSTIAMALAHGLAASAAQPGDVLLADLALRAHQAMYHDAGDVIPGLQDLVDATRRGDPGPGVVRDLTWRVDARGYRLLLGLRRPRDWTVLRAGVVGACIDALTASFRHVVFDVDGDLDGEAETGSADLDDRSSAARLAVATADLTVVVIDASLRGLHDGAALLGEVRVRCRDARRPDPVVVVNRSPRRRSERAELTGALDELAGRPASGPSAVHVPVVRQFERRHLHAAPPPDALVHPVVGAVRAVTARPGTGASAAAGVRTLTGGRR